MTYVDISPEQHDAEAAAPRNEQPITDLIEDHRHLYRSDLFHPQLHPRSGSGKTSRSWDDEAPVVDDSGRSSIGWTGKEFNGAFLRYVDWDRKDQIEGVRPSFPGQRFPWSTALTQQWAECRRFHREHRGRPEWRGSLCRQLVSLTVRSEPSMSLESACLVLGVTPPRASRTLRTALLWIEAAMDRADRRQKERAKPVRERILWRDEHERHNIPGLHAEDCVQCRRAG